MKARRCSATFSSRGLGYPKSIYAHYGDAVSEGLVSVIPTHRPPRELVTLVEHLRHHGSVIVSDDASPCTFDPVLAQVADLENVTVVRHECNAGIARGLNEGLLVALESGSSWLLTVDQDTVLPEDYVTHMLAWLNRHHDHMSRMGVVGAGEVIDGDARIRYPSTIVEGVRTTAEVIQTGSLWQVEALSSIGGFDESFGIDAVDAAACVRLRSVGFLVAVADGLALEHAIGSSRRIRAFGRDIMVTGHSPERRTSMLRNRLRLFPEEFRQSPRHAFRSIRRVIVNQSAGLILESGRKDKAIGTLRGLRGSSSDTLEP